MSSSFWNRRPFESNDESSESEERGVPISSESDLSKLFGNIDTQYVVEVTENTNETSYQDASGAPIERVSPLGYSVGPLTIFFLNLSKMIGTGIFTTPSTILRGTGSIGLSLIWWALGFITSMSSFCIYLEFAAYFPSRSGAEVVYLEQAFPRPRWLFPTAFAFQSVILSFSSGNAYVLAEYVFKMTDHTPTDWQLKAVAVAAYTVVVLSAVLHNRYSYWVINGVGLVKIGTLLFISITGFVVLGGHTNIPTPTANFHDAFKGNASTYGITNALYKIIFSYAGFENAFNVVNEVKNPVKQIRRNGFLAICVVTVLYTLTVTAYYTVATKEEIISSKLTVANLLFTKVFGPSHAVKGLNFLIVLSAFGNMVSVLMGTSRIIRECGRQGVLPFPEFWVSTWPFGTTLGPFVFKYCITILMILAPPAGDAFNFVTDLSIYPGSFFNLLVTIGLLVVRHRRQKLDLPQPVFKAWNIVVLFTILQNLYLLVMPWYPPTGGAHGGDVSFWYGTYIVTSIGILFGCVVYYWLWIKAIPHLKGYEIRQESFSLPDGSSSYRLVKVAVAELKRWDETHDRTGRLLLAYRPSTQNADILRAK